LTKKTPSATDFAQKMDLPKTTIQGIVTLLVELRYLEKDQLSSKYRLAPGSFNWA
jgi:DNA-binding IclR family transcriptional regulator